MTALVQCGWCPTIMADDYLVWDLHFTEVHGRRGYSVSPIRGADWDIAELQAGECDGDRTGAPEGAVRQGGLPQADPEHTSEMRTPRSQTVRRGHEASTSRPQGERADGSIAGTGDCRQGGNE